MSLNTLTDWFTKWLGSTSSIIVHTIIFTLFLIAPWVVGISTDSSLLILTTVVSLEAIYLAIFIQRTVNRQAERLDDVEESIDDVEEAIDDVEEAIDDVEEGLESSHAHHKKTGIKSERTLQELEKTMKEIHIILQQLTDHPTNKK